jgi:hypothetical protein
MWDRKEESTEMPSSTWVHVYDASQIIRQMKPKVIVDVGSGIGKWGFVCRDVLDIQANRLTRDEWQHRIIGIEPFMKYHENFLTSAYNALWCGRVDTVEMLASVEAVKPDLVILGDMLEHLKYEDAVALVRNLKCISTQILIGLPIGNWPQGTVYGNVLETHISTWTHKLIADGAFGHCLVRWYAVFNTRLYALILTSAAGVMNKTLYGIQWDEQF